MRVFLIRGLTDLALVALLLHSFKYSKHKTLLDFALNFSTF